MVTLEHWKNLKKKLRKCKEEKRKAETYSSQMTDRLRIAKSLLERNKNMVDNRLLPHLLKVLEGDYSTIVIDEFGGEENGN